VKTTTLRLAVAVCGIVSLVSPALILAAGSPAPQSQGQPAQKNWKDRDEYDLYTSITTEANAQKKLDLLNQWGAKYPNTDFKTERTTLYLTTYVQLNRPRDAVASAKQLVTDNPRDFTGLYYMTLLTLQAADVSAGALDDSDKAANGLLGALDEQFAPAKKNPQVSDADWAKARSDTEALAHTILGWVAMQRKDNTKAEQEFTKSLQLSPASGQVSYWLGSVIVGQKDQAKLPAALYDIARAAAYDGPGALDAGFRQTSVRPYLEKLYNAYHGSKDGVSDLLAATKASALPPGDFKIKSAEDIEKEKLAAEQDLATKDPSLALWLNVRTALTGADGATYFASNMKGAQTPAFTGKLISATPETKPKTLVLAIADKDSKTPVGDATINLDAPLPGKAEGDTMITFQGIPDSYTTSPFMVTFNAAKADIKGWTGKEAPVHHTPVRRRPAAK
jgi:Flp pilus assembly protein TadD